MLEALLEQLKILLGKLAAALAQPASNMPALPPKQPQDVSNVPTPIPAPSQPIQVPQSVLSPLAHFCLAIRDYEGKPGDLNYKNNNPGNCRCSSTGYLPKYGNVKCVNNFAVFPTYELGWQYLLALVTERINQHPDWTILDFFEHYAPTSDNNDPRRYAAYVASRIAVDITYKIKNLLS